MLGVAQISKAVPQNMNGAGSQMKALRTPACQMNSGLEKISLLFDRASLCFRFAAAALSGMTRLQSSELAGYWSEQQERRPREKPSTAACFSAEARFDRLKGTTIRANK